jgi:hypothetical protein
MLFLPPNIKVNIMVPPAKEYERVFQLIDSRLPRDLYFIVSFSHTTTAAILTDKDGNRDTDWSQQELDQLSFMNHTDRSFTPCKLGIIKTATFLSVEDASVGYNYMIWGIAGIDREYYYIEFDEDLEDIENLLALRKVIRDQDPGHISKAIQNIQDTFTELYGEKLELYQKYTDLIATFTKIDYDDITRIHKANLDSATKERELRAIKS